MTAFPYGTGMCLTEIPGPLADPERSAGRAAWGVFLWFLSLHEQRGASQQPNGWSRDAPAASGAMPDLRQARPKVLSTGSSRVCVFSESRMLSAAGFQALADFVALSPTPLPQEEGLDRVPLKPG